MLFAPQFLPPVGGGNDPLPPWIDVVLGLNIAVFGLWESVFVTFVISCLVQLLRVGRGILEVRSH